MDESLINTEISRGDPCFAVSEDPTTNEIEDSNKTDGSDKSPKISDPNVPGLNDSIVREIGENSAFTKVAPSGQPWTTSEEGEIPKEEELSLFMPPPEGAEKFDVPELIYLDAHTSQMFNAALSAENDTESSGVEIQSEMFANTDTINVPQQNHSHGSTSPVSGNIPPHNTPLIGSSKGEINLQDVRLALTQVFNNELADEQHVDNGHDFRRSVSADVYHEKDKDHTVKLRHNSGKQWPISRVIIRLDKVGRRKIICLVIRLYVNKLSFKTNYAVST